MGEPTCTWIVEGRVDVDGREFECGDKAYVIFSRKVKVMNKPVTHTYPRCRKHAPQRVVKMARDGFASEGGFVQYDVKFVKDATMGKSE